MPVDRKVAFPCPSCKNIIELVSDTSNRKDDYLDSTGQSETEKTNEPLLTLESKCSKLKGDPLKNIILKNLNDLPAMPQIVLKAQEIIVNPNSNFKEFERTIETDQALVAKVLRLANSAYYGQSGKVSSIKRASVVLGYNSIGELVTIAGTSGLLDRPLKGYGLKPGDLWRHSISVAFGSKIIANRKVPELENDAFIGGLLHDVGKIILNQYVLEKKTTSNGSNGDGHKKLLKAEKSIFGFDHANIAATVCAKWNFPKPIYKAIEYHHAPHKFGLNKLACMIYVVDELSHLNDEEIESVPCDFGETATNQLNIEEDELGIILSEMKSSINQLSNEVGMS